MNEIPKILVVDDIEVNRTLLRDIITKLGYEILLAENGLSALANIEKYLPDLIILDIKMPVMDGFQVLERLRTKSEYNYVPVIVVSAVDDMESIAKCIQLGADDYMVKPFNLTLLQARISSCLEKKRYHDYENSYRSKIEEYNLHLEDRVREEVKRVSKSQSAVIFALAKLTESRDLETGEHLERVREYCKILTEHLQKQAKFKSIIDKNYIENIYATSPLHDIGKVGIPDRILLKPGKLTPDEWEIIKTHTTIGAETLQAVYDEYPDNEFIRMGIEIAHSHHEWWNGSGYPQGLEGEKIPLAGRIVALADVYDALMSDRCYRKAFSYDKTRALIENEKGTHFDPDIVDAFFVLEKDFLSIQQHFKDEESQLSTKFDFYQ